MSALGETAIEPHSEASVRERLAQLPQDTAQDADRAQLGRGVARAENSREEILVGLVVEAQEADDR